MKGVQSVRILGLTLAVVGPCGAQIASSSFTVPAHPRGTFNLAQVYPSTVASYPVPGIEPMQTWGGNCGVQPLTQGAVPGILSLRRTDQFRLDASCFAIIPEGQQGPCHVQSFHLIKEVPGSFKCPDVYGTPHFDANGNLVPYRFFQFGSGVRTWWSLNFTQPGTRFVLEVVSVCFGISDNEPRVHKDIWVWRVMASTDTLLNSIELMHGGAISTLEVPCILSEDMYVALKEAATTLKAMQATGSRLFIGNALFDMEALIVANCLFIEVLRPTLVFPGMPLFGQPAAQPPGNLAQMVFMMDGGSSIAGLVDTVENPCCCKLLVDLEWIAIKSGILANEPTLPVF